MGEKSVQYIVCESVLHASRVCVLLKAFIVVKFTNVLIPKSVKLLPTDRSYSDENNASIS